MRYSLLRYISRKLAKGEKGKFLAFARKAAFAGAFLGAFALATSISVIEGFDFELKTTAEEFSSAVFVKRYDQKLIRRASLLERKIKRALPEASSINKTLEWRVLLSKGDKADDAIIRAVGTSADLIERLKKNLAAGSLDFSSPFAKEIAISKRISRKFGVSLGDYIVLFGAKRGASSLTEAPAIEKLEVVGIYETGFAQYDEKYCFAPEGTVRKLFDIPRDAATSVDVKGIDLEKSPEAAAKLNARIGYPYFAFSIYDLRSAIFAWIEAQKKPIPIILGLISLVAAANILTTLLISAMEKTREIGILRSLGASRADIIKMFSIRGTAIGFFGALSGSAFAFILGAAQSAYKIIKLQGDVYFLDALPVKLEFWTFAISVLAAAFLGFIASLVPAYVASKISPAKALRFK